MTTAEELESFNVDYKDSKDRGDVESSEPDSVQTSNRRGTWANKAEFFLSILGYTIGIGSIWRFPMVLSRNGGGAFLIPFFLFLFLCGGPLYYLEVCLGQFTGKSAGLSFEFCTLLRGLGLLQVILSSTVLWYGMSVFAWTLYFLYSSFMPVLPWTTCDGDWNTDKCQDLWNKANTSMTANDSTTEFSSAAYEFFQYKVIARSSGLEEMGSVQPHLVICLFLSWFLVVLAVVKGVQSLGKVVYVTATLPYILLVVIFIRGLTLEGAVEGVVFYLKPDFSKLLGFQVWLEASIQVFYSLGPGWGGVITMASYNRFHQKSFWCSTACVISCGLTSFFNGLVVFTVIGFMAKESGIAVQQLATQSGSGLAFIVFPTAISRLPVPHLWAVIFFLTLITVVFDSLFGMFETVTSGVIDLFPKHLTKRRPHVNIAAGIIFFILSIPCAMNGGIYIFQLGDWYFGTFALIFGSFFEVAGISWIYGLERFSLDIKIMTGRDVSVLLRCLWAILVPVAAFFLFFVAVFRYSSPNYGDGYVYSDAGIAFGFVMALLPIAGMLGVAIITLVRMEGSFLERLRQGLQPSSKWSPNDETTQQKYPLCYMDNSDSVMQRLLINLRGGKERTCV